MDDLNKQQVILLAILVSVVTSIATGITTVALVAQSPAPTQTVTQTVNRIVEKTIERVVEGEPVEPEIVVIEKEPETVNEEERTVKAIAASTQSLVRIYEDRGERPFVALGFVIRDDGMIYVPAQFYSTRREYTARYQGQEFEVERVHIDSGQRYVILAPKETQTISFVPVSLGDSNNLKIGQSVISVGGSANPVVSKGIVSSLNTTSGVLNSVTEGEIEAPVVTIINTSADGDKIITGSVLVNLNGKVIGVKMGREGSPASFSAVSILKDAILNSPVRGGDGAETAGDFEDEEQGDETENA